MSELGDGIYGHQNRYPETHDERSIENTTNLGHIANTQLRRFQGALMPPLYCVIHSTTDLGLDGCSYGRRSVSVLFAQYTSYWPI